MSEKERAGFIAEFEVLTRQILEASRRGPMDLRVLGKRRELIKRLSFLLERMYPKSTQGLLSPMAAAVALLLSSGCGFADNWYGIQNIPAPDDEVPAPQWGFAAGQSDPFNLALATSLTPGVLANFTMADYDGDGDGDLVFYDHPQAGYGFYDNQIVVNTGTAATANFDSSASILGPINYGGFGASNNSLDFEFVNIDGDGDTDLYTLNRVEGVYVHRWDTSSGFPVYEYSFIRSPEGFGIGEFKDLSFVDIDSDGDLDALIAGEYFDYYTGLSEPRLYFYENTGTSLAPAFASTPLPEGLGSLIPSNGLLERISFVDIDKDGDSDAFTLVNQSLQPSVFDFKLFFHENTGTPELADFAAGINNPSGMEGTVFHENVSMAFFDIDNDGDMDLMVMDRYVSAGPPPDPGVYDDFILFENTLYN